MKGKIYMDDIAFQMKGVLGRGDSGSGGLGSE
jgi:hypothetical protein